MRRTWLLLALVFSFTSRADAASTYAFVTATDFGGPGCASWAELNPPRTAHNCVEDLSSDPVARWAHGRVYVVNRFGSDNIQVLDPSNGFGTLLEFSVGNGTNPQDIAVASATKAYISLFNANYLLVVNPETGVALDSIPLGEFADADGSPEATKLLLYGDRLFVAMQRLFSFAPTDHSSVAAVDLSTDTVLDANPGEPGVQAIRLLGRNPISDFAVDPVQGRILIGTVGAFGTNDDGGVEGIDPASLTATGYEATEAQLQGEVSDIAIGAAGERFAVREGFDFNDPSEVVRYSPGSGQVTQTVFSTGEFSVGDIETNDRGELWVCDRTLLQPGLRVYAVADGSGLAGPIDVGLPPFDICFDQAIVAEAPREHVASIRLYGVAPNPGREGIGIRFGTGAKDESPVRLRVLDARGAIVEDLSRTFGPGTHTWSWRAPAGATPGVYFFRLERAGESADGRFVIVR